MRDEQRAKLLGVCVDVEADLREDGEPNVFGANTEVVMLVIGHDGGVDEAVGGGMYAVEGGSGHSGLAGGSGTRWRKRRRVEAVSEGGGLGGESFAMTARLFNVSSAVVTSMRTSSNPTNEPTSPFSPRGAPDSFLTRNRVREQEGRLEEFAAGLALGAASLLEEVHGASGYLRTTTVDDISTVGCWEDCDWHVEDLTVRRSLRGDSNGRFLERLVGDMAGEG